MNGTVCSSILKGVFIKLFIMSKFLETSVTWGVMTGEI